MVFKGSFKGVEDNEGSILGLLGCVYRRKGVISDVCCYIHDSGDLFVKMSVFMNYHDFDDFHQKS